VKPPSAEWLAFAAVSQLRASGWRRVFRVRSPRTPSSYKDFMSLEAIPNDFFDKKAKQSFKVDPSMITIVLKSD